PYGHVSSVPRTVPTYGAVEERFDALRPQLVETIRAMGTHQSEIERAIKDGVFPWEDAGMFPMLDAVVAYYMVKHHRPKRIVEIGSGASTHVLSCALAQNGAGSLTCIDPAPRRSILDTPAKIHQRVLAEGDVSLLDAFEPNDILFIDSSHIMLPGMDVDIQFNRMFPVLSPGTLVHVHDIFLPDGYPESWSDRLYSEQNALIGWIMSGFFEVLYPGYYVATRMVDDLKTQLGPLMPEAPERNAGSIWLRVAG
ncbi:MAG: class I SAM-dependent methyltransferase, partial [Pseudomonadota bacterium]